VQILGMRYFGCLGQNNYFRLDANVPKN